MRHLYSHLVRCNTIKKFIIRRCISSCNSIKLNSSIVNGNSDKHAIFLHGLFGSGSNWRSIATSISRITEVNCHLLDARNHGSSPHTDTIGYFQMADDILLYLQDNNINSCTIVGHSMGGKTAMNLAIKSPSVVERLIVVDISPVSYGLQTYDFLTNILKAVKNLDLETLNDRKQVDQALKYDIPQDIVRSFIMQNLKTDPNNGNKFIWRFNLDLLYKSLLDWIDVQIPNGTFTGPSLFIFGAKSQYFDEQHFPAVKRYFPDSEIKVIPDATHYLHYEKQQQVLDVIIKFLKQ